MSLILFGLPYHCRLLISLHTEPKPPVTRSMNHGIEKSMTDSGMLFF